MPGRLADFLRFWWDLFYWNARKTVFRWRGSRCPCQNPSDTGRALETACDACLAWRQPVRFQRVCPLLVATADGLRCSADSKDVRPFWGRAAVYYGGAFAALYLAAVLGAFAFLCGIGYPVHLTSVAWPRAWPEIRVARGEYFYRKANRAFRANRLKEGVIALAYAYQLDPRNFAAGLALAKLWQSSPAQSDSIYARLLHDDATESGRIAEEWYRALLARGDFQKIAQAAPLFLARDPAHAQIWLHALFFATRRLGDVRPLRQLLDQGPSLAPNLRRLAEIELLADTGHVNDAHRSLQNLHIDGPYVAFYQVGELIALGFPDEALAALNRQAGLLPIPEDTSFRLSAFAAKGWPNLVRNEVELVLNAPVGAASVDSLCAHFIRHPDPDLLAAIFNKLRQEPLPNSDEAYDATCALFCAAGVNADWKDLLAARRLLQRLSGSPYNSLDRAEAFFRSHSPGQRLGGILPIFPHLSLDVSYAMFEHYADGRPAAP
jgi:hypothetical protein